MKKLAALSLIIFLSVSGLHAQILNTLFKKDSSGNSGISKIIKQATAPQGLSNQEIISGLKEALNVGATNSTRKLSVTDGFFRDAAVKVLLPAEAASVEKKLRAFGMGKLVDDAVLSMNRAAEDAAKSAAPIFLDAVKKMSIQDALGILRGDNFAATNYLKSQTSSSLTEAFRPVIQSSIDKVNATKYWNTVFTTYNRFSSEKVNTDLTAYITEKALAGIFYQLGLEEQKIRKDPMARTTDLLKKVFAN
jgi:hypothetical protein